MSYHYHLTPYVDMYRFYINLVYFMILNIKELYMNIKLFFISSLTILALNGCTSSMANAMGGSLAGEAIQYNNEQYSEK